MESVSSSSSTSSFTGDSVMVFVPLVEPVGISTSNAATAAKSSLGNAVPATTSTLTVVSSSGAA